MKKIGLLIAIFLFVSAASQAQLLIDESFSYPSGDSLNQIHGGWFNYGTGAIAPLVVSPGLKYNNYGASGIGNALHIGPTGEDVALKVSKASDSVGDGVAYTAFMVKVKSAGTGDYFFQMQNYTMGSANRARVYIKTDPATNKFYFGLLKGNPTTPIYPVLYTTSLYSLDTTYLIVMKYTINSGTNNDFVSMWINSNLSTAETLPLLKDSTAATDLPGIGAVCFRQGTTGAAPDVIVDGVRLATKWTSLNLITSVKDTKEIPSEFILEQNFPNPFNPSTIINYSIPAESKVTLKIYNMLGKEISTLINGVQAAGKHSVSFNAGNLASGTYFYRLKTGNIIKTGKMLLLK